MEDKSDNNKSYHPRNPQEFPLQQLLNNHYYSFEQGYDERFEEQYGFFRPIINEVVHEYLA